MQKSLCAEKWGDSQSVTPAVEAVSDWRELLSLEPVTELVDAGEGVFSDESDWAMMPICPPIVISSPDRERKNERERIRRLRLRAHNNHLKDSLEHLQCRNTHLKKELTSLQSELQALKKSVRLALRPA